MIITLISVAGILWISRANKRDAKLKSSNVKDEVYSVNGNAHGFTGGVTK